MKIVNDLESWGGGGGKQLAKPRMQLSITRSVRRPGGGKCDLYHPFSGIAMVPSALMMLCMCSHCYHVSSRCTLLAASSIL